MKQRISLLPWRRMKRVLFICSGNSCRSAAAEYVLRKMLAERRCSDIDVSSAGTVDWGINPRDAEMVRIAAEHGYKIKGKTRPMRPGMVQKADLIIVMAHNHKEKVCELLPPADCGKVRLFMEYCFGEDTALQDPGFQSEYVYRTVFDTIERGCRIIADKLTANIQTNTGNE